MEPYRSFRECACDTAAGYVFVRVGGGGGADRPEAVRLRFGPKP